MTQGPKAKGQPRREADKGRGLNGSRAMLATASLLTLLLLLVGLLAAAGCGAAKTTGTAAPEASGSSAPDFSGSTLTGEQVSLGSYRGKALVLAFMASW
ncbi:MAG: redoxin domain-containing protein [Thermoleophilia bacterium]|nr:redoxin domain-containing protein [Thermoleophilia bacterium]